jgi:hypothetical protein
VEETAEIPVCHAELIRLVDIAAIVLTVPCITWNLGLGFYWIISWVSKNTPHRVLLQLDKDGRTRNSGPAPSVYPIA